MTIWTLLLIILSLLAFVVGQLCFKSAASTDENAGSATTAPRPAGRRAAIFGAGIVCMTVSFFINLGLLQSYDLSFLFPFQGLSVLIVSLGACVFLRERLTVPLVVGALLITAGVVLVSMSDEKEHQGAPPAPATGAVGGR